MAKHDGKIGKGQDGKWRIPKLTVDKNDDIAWSTNDGTGFCIWFPPDRDPLVGGKNRSPNGSLDRKVAPNANPGTYPYSIYRYADNTMVEGPRSSPEMIVQ